MAENITRENRPNGDARTIYLEPPHRGWENQSWIHTSFITYPARGTTLCTTSCKYDGMRSTCCDKAIPKWGREKESIRRIERQEDSEGPPYTPDKTTPEGAIQTEDTSSNIALFKHATL